jgi:DUF438 domain-containing protein
VIHDSDDTKNTGILDLSMGHLALEQINMMLQNLPVDISFVDENDLVAKRVYFSMKSEYQRTGGF